MEFLLAITLLLAPAYALRFSIAGFSTNVLMVWTFLAWAMFGLYLLIKKQGKAWTLHIAGMPKTLLVFIGLFFAAGILSTLTKGVDAKKIGQFIVLFLQPVSLFFIASFIWQQYATAKKYFVWAGFILLAVSGAYAIVQYVSLHGLPPSYWGNSVEPKRAISFFGQPDFYSLFTAPLMAFLLPFITLEENTRETWAKAALWLVSGAGLLLSLSRSGWIGLAVTTIVFIVVGATPKIKKISAVLGAVIILIVLITPILRYRVVLPFMGDKSTVSRFSLWRTGLKGISESPVLGLGLDGFGNNWKRLNTDYNLVDTANFPHNIFLDFWVDTGLLGLVSFIGLLAYGLYVGFSNKQYPYLFAMALFLLCLVIQGQFDNPYFRNDLALVFWLVLSLGSYYKKSPLPNRNKYHTLTSYKLK